MSFVNRLLLSGMLGVVLQCLMVNTDKEVLHILTLNLPGYNSYNEMITLENGELVVGGNWTVELGPPNQEGLITIAITEYTIDKNGYHSQYRTDEVPMVEKRLSEGFLKSAAG
ncbi:PREDICTED: uncharacterized protein LOC108977556 [Bactrocera latifrons]|uniref:Uncharacterized protein n=1 Tax=Bactrocera latifrons TaxID=174628 RepID=A0A0K8U419_BACLA|nr:PREDICTED: uncharacterized protein LOC108977556 [Bactrocera latifrons]